MLTLSSLSLLRGSELMKELERLYRPHRITDYVLGRICMYNQADCYKDTLYRLYTGTHIHRKCSQQVNTQNVKTEANAEHVVPQNLFNKKEPYVSDLHHLFSAGEAENNRRSNYIFGEFPYDECDYFCRDLQCSQTVPPDPENYSCLSKGKKRWMPIKADRGTVARAVLYFQTVYPEVDISEVNNITLYVKWNREYPPTERDLYRNDMVNLTQGNRNPYVDNPSLVDRVFEVKE